MSVNTFKNKVNSLKNALNNPNEFIYDECNEIKCVIQLESEQMIANIKVVNNLDVNLDETENDLDLDQFELVKNLKQQCNDIITQIDIHEKQVKSHWTDQQNEIDKKVFNRELNKLVQFCDLFLNKCLDRLVTFNEAKIFHAIEKLNEYKIKGGALR